jgi:Fe-S oxidoreductase
MEFRLCYQCGTCTAVCPLRYLSKFSPRQIVYESRFEEQELWKCLTCNSCYAVCPQKVDFPGFILSERRGKIAPEISHHGIFSLLARLMAESGRGISSEYQGEIDEESSTGFFAGCVDLFDLFLDLFLHSDFGNFHEIGEASIKLLNIIGIRPRVVELKCCGHDVLYQGDTETFKKISEWNVKRLKELKIEKLILSCAECYMTFCQHYQLDLEILHISQVLSGIPEGRKERRVALHDACRLGRYMNEYDAPRRALTKVAKLVELPHSRERSWCCGVSAWMNCDDLAKVLRRKKLQEVKRSGAEELITTCTKCLAHLSCLKREEDFGFEITDFSVFLATNLK